MKRGISFKYGIYHICGYLFSIYFFIHTFIIDVSGACSFLAVNCFIFEILHTWGQFILQVMNSIGAVEFDERSLRKIENTYEYDGWGNLQFKFCICVFNFSLYFDCRKQFFPLNITNVPYVDYVFYKLNILVYNNNILLVRQ